MICKAELFFLKMDNALQRQRDSYPLTPAGRGKLHVNADTACSRVTRRALSIDQLPRPAGGASQV